MVHKYSNIPQIPERTCKACGSSLRAHFKITHEAAVALKGMTLTRAKAYLANVLNHKEIIPFRRYRYGISRHAQVKQFHHVTQGAWPVKSTQYLIDLLKNAEANAVVKQLDTDRLKITHIQVNKAPKTHRRTYRAHGRITAYKGNPCHIEMILTEKPKKVQKGKVKPTKAEN